jgi:hypothetical protein
VSARCPRLEFPLRWRLELFSLMVRANQHLPLAPRREPCSLFSAEAEATADAAQGQRPAAPRSAGNARNRAGDGRGDGPAHGRTAAHKA